MILLLIYCTNDELAGIDISDHCYLAYKSKSYRMVKKANKLRAILTKPLVTQYLMNIES